MKYPAIVYEVNDITPQFAGNLPYRLDTRYKVTVIDRIPDSDIPIKIAALPTCRFDRSFVSDNLYHFVLNLYF